jgi:hypothetical protein
MLYATATSRLLGGNVMKSIWTKKFADMTLKDGVIVALIGVMISAIPMFVIGLFNKLKR